MGKIMRNGVQYGVDTADVLSTVAECDASASGGKGTTQVASAKALSELNSNLKANFQAGVDSIYDACVAKGATPASKSLSDIVDGVTTVYNIGYKNGKENAVAGGIPGRIYVALTAASATLMASGTFDATNYKKLYIPIGSRGSAASGEYCPGKTTFNFYNSSNSLITSRSYENWENGYYQSINFEVDLSSISGDIRFEFSVGINRKGSADDAVLYSAGTPWLE